MPQKLTDGNPLTLDWLNTLVTEIDDLRSLIAPGFDVRKPVTYSGNKIASVSKVQIEANQTKVSAPPTGLTNQLITFSKPFNTAPIVVATLLRNGVVTVSLVIKSTTATSFTIALGPHTQKTAIDYYVNYIAIGESKV